jgi:hypothetical protein
MLNLSILVQLHTSMGRYAFHNRILGSLKYLCLIINIQVVFYLYLTYMFNGIYISVCRCWWGGVDVGTVVDMLVE